MSSRTPTQTLGALGEELAAKYLKDKGYTILEKNFTIHHVGEIDLIAKKDDEIIFIEVKTRTGERYGYPEEAVNYWKTKKMLRAARHFLHTRHIDDTYIRFDSISVTMDEKNKKHTLRHNEDIPIPL